MNIKALVSILLLVMAWSGLFSMYHVIAYHDIGWVSLFVYSLGFVLLHGLVYSILETKNK